MQIERLIKLNILLWGILVISLVLFLARPKKAGTEDGMGGAITAEEFVFPAFDEEAVDLELEGIPEPEEFSRPRMLTFSSYTMEAGDMIGRIAIRAGLSEDSLISVNDIKNTRLMQIGQVIKIPNQDGIYYSVKSGETLESIAEKYNTTVAHIKTVNELFSDTVPANTSLFIPGAKLDWTSRQEINGDLFIWPTSGRISSPYGYRMAPFARVRAFHSGIDITAPMGSPIKAAMAGRVTQVGNDESWGNFVVISHHSGYRTFYAHMSVVRVKAGAYVENGERIGDVGSTGLSTGPHVHFTVYKNGVTVSPLSLMRN
jgi:murein DD-endopeptidase MepM/ murein hydrolase activator NlpD